MSVPWGSATGLTVAPTVMPLADTCRQHVPLVALGATTPHCGSPTISVISRPLCRRQQLLATARQNEKAGWTTVLHATCICAKKHAENEKMRRMSCLSRAIWATPEQHEPVPILVAVTILPLRPHTSRSTLGPSATTLALAPLLSHRSHFRGCRALGGSSPRAPCNQQRAPAWSGEG